MKTSALLLLGMITVTPAACTAGGDADKVSGEGPKDAITLLREAAADGQAVRSAVTERVRSLVAPQLAPGSAAAERERVVSLELAKTGEKASSANPNEPRQGDTGEVAYTFAYQETSPTVQVFAEGTVAASFAFDGTGFVLDEQKGIAVDAPRYGVTDIIEGNVQDCTLDAATPAAERDAPLYKAEISIYFRDGHFKRIYTDQRGDYVIRAVKGEQVTVTATLAGYEPQTVETFVPDGVDFSLCPVKEPPPATVTIEGVVSYANGVSASGALVQAYAGGVPVAGSSIANASGAYRLLQVPVTVTSVGAVLGTKSAAVDIDPPDADLAGVDIMLPNAAPTCSLAVAQAVYRVGETIVPVVTTNDVDGDAVTFSFAAAGDIITTPAGTRAWRLPGLPGEYALRVDVSDGVAGGTCSVEVSAAVPAFNALKVEGGVFHTCALLDDGTVRCWGANAYGQLGNGTIIGSSVPVAVNGITSAVDLAVGGYHTCVVLAGGAVQCWGMNQYGQLGDGSRTQRNAPVFVDRLLSPAVQVVAGSAFTCARAATWPLQCWGIRNHGQIGDGSYSPWEQDSYSSPVSVVAVGGSYITNAETLEAGGAHACVLRGGALMCWGLNGHGELGLGTQIGPDNCQSPYHANPYYCSMTARLSLLTADVEDVMAGQYETCAMMKDSTLRCFGSNGDAQLGIGPGERETCTVNSTGPCSVSVIESVKTALGAPLTGVTGLLQGTPNGHACVSVGAAVYCWGANYNGQLGGAAPSGSAFALEITSVTPGLSKLGAGFYHTCGVTTGGAVECWGRNAEGQLGSGATGAMSLPVRVQGF